MATAYFVEMWEWASQKLPSLFGGGADVSTFLCRGSKKSGKSILFVIKASAMLLPCPTVQR